MSVLLGTAGSPFIRRRSLADASYDGTFTRAHAQGFMLSPSTTAGIIVDISRIARTKTQLFAEGSAVTRALFIPKRFEGVEADGFPGLVNANLSK